ncbi:54S ribosomal protein L35, mitochondrial [Psilocybe cubensis]|uniref:PEBP-like protein n=2 Tax=Psilocybe cubensis TaxID=181762 RepID=A0A8H8CR10_PSICU|nr:54S ribosomal protein L35, mitochondrial [Psilocybe cubensis]KAH9487184.1 54S ribosomal protein L35, mitochondrial [Psilocybe cubensis]
MFALRCRSGVASALRVRVVSRGLATAVPEASTSASSTVPPPTYDDAVPAAKTTNGRTGLSARRRRAAALSGLDLKGEDILTVKKWNRALPRHVIPAYDLALGVLEEDSRKLKAEVLVKRKAIEGKLQALEKLLAKGEGEGEVESLKRELEALLEKADVVEVQSEVNLPQVRWAVKNALADMNKLSHRHLIEQKWRKDGDLDLLMERLYQMNVIPDVLPILEPTVDLHLVAKARPTEYLKIGKLQTTVVPGEFIRPKQTLVPPKLYATVFHTDVRLYTMILVDPDVPSPETASYTTYLHWMKPNIPLSATSPHLIPDLNDHTAYVPPHPQRGSPYHRYVCLLLPQPALAPEGYTRVGSVLAARQGNEQPTSQRLDIPVVPEEERRGFDVRAFMEKWGFEGRRGGGAHMFREVWDEDVSAIYKDVLKQPEPHYGQPPKRDPYAQIKQQKKYHL